MLLLGGRDLGPADAPELAAALLPGVLQARELSHAVAMDLARMLVPARSLPAVPAPVYTRAWLTAAVRQVLSSPNRTAAAVGQRAVRHAEQANRETVIAASRRVDGWARAGNGSTCSFCLLLISRGPVYHSQRASGFSAHDRCRCAAVPVVGNDWPGRDQYAWASGLYAEATASEGDKLNAFRRAVYASDKSDT